MKITIDTKWIESLVDFDTETKVVLYEAIFDYMSDKEEVRLPDDTWKMFAILKTQLDEEKFKRMRLAERSRANGAKGGRKKEFKPKEEKVKHPTIPEGERSERLLSLDKWMERTTPYLYKNIRLLTQKEFDALCEKYDAAQICDELQKIENRKDLRKNYTNLYRTLLNWLKNG
jgi:hypothetical protein